MGDFMIAGGAILFCISIMDLLTAGQQRRIPSQDLGPVPIGTPLIVGPAVLTTSLIMIDTHGLTITLIAVLINIVLTGLVFLCSDTLIRILGIAGARVLSKVTSLLLAAIAIMMIRKGIFAILALPMV
jgi:multiple antibiotic resistance protein